MPTLKESDLMPLLDYLNFRFKGDLKELHDCLDEAMARLYHKDDSREDRSRILYLCNVLVELKSRLPMVDREG